MSVSVAALNFSFSSIWRVAFSTSKKSQMLSKEIKGNQILIRRKVEWFFLSVRLSACLCPSIFPSFFARAFFSAGVVWCLVSGVKSSHVVVVEINECGSGVGSLVWCLWSGVWSGVWSGGLGCFRRTDFLLPPPAVSLYGERKHKREREKEGKDTLINKVPINTQMRR